uniref:BACK domain-containing protein n=1 Tax=Globodera pallida TaxID=36090 RepID=A0A183CQ28_GLOPA
MHRQKTKNPNSKKDHPVLAKLNQPKCQKQTLRGGDKGNLLPAMSACTLSWPTDSADVHFLVGEGDEKKLLCLDYIDRNAYALILSDAFLQIDQQLLCEILDRDELWISEEIAIWNA